MTKAHRKETYRTAGYSIEVIGVPVPGLRDLYHALLRVPWWATLGVIVGGYLALNAVFALLYLLTGGVASVRPGSFLDAFFFSVQTMGTIGYGDMHPATTAANLLMVGESVTGLIVTAMATGLVFVRFSQTRARLMFSAKVAVGRMDGMPTLMVRIGNERRGNIVDCRFHLSITRKTKTAEGVVIYRLDDLPLVRSRAPALSRAWTVMHVIADGSPLHGYDADRLAEVEGELQLEVMGIDDTSLQPVHGRYTWFAGSVAWDARLADVLSETPEGDMVVDLRQFHEVVSVE